MNKITIAIATVTVAYFAHSAETIYRGSSADAKNVVCYYQGGKFFADQARKDCLYHHPGNCVCKGAGPASAYKNALYRFSGGRIYKGASLKKEDAIASIVEYRTLKGDTVEAKIYDGYVVARDEVRTTEADKSVKFTYNLTRDAVNVVDIPVLYTIEKGKIYKGDSTDPANCLLSYTGSFNASRLLFMAVELTGKER